MIALFAKRPLKKVIWNTGFGAIVGAFGNIAMGTFVVSMMWIPLCFITIPVIHVLCQKVHELTSRLEAIEKGVSESDPAE